MDNRASSAHVGGASGANPNNVRKSRSRSGCLSCRTTRVKCGEQRPACTRCVERKQECLYPPPNAPLRRQFQPRRVKSCDPCRKRKARCDGQPGEPCRSCQSRGVACEWRTSPRSASVEMRAEARSASPHSGSMSGMAFPPTTSGPAWVGSDLSTSSIRGMPASSSISSAERVLSGGYDADVKALLKLYFSTVHQFGLFCFIHEPDFWERYAQHKIPASLILIMAASAIRFGGRTESQTLFAQADEWAKEAGDRLLSTVFDEFGATELMEVVLCHHYDFQSGRYSRGWMMGGMATRMMTFLRLNMLDETPHPHPKPFLSVETLRRLAWAVWYLDATMDGGNFGFATIGEGAMTIQLPCDERSFLLHQPVTTQSLVPTPIAMEQPASLGLAAHVIRAMYARQILADVHSRLQRRLVSPTAIEEFVLQAVARSTAVLESLPPELSYNRSLYYAYKDQQSLLLHLHVMRNTARRHVALLRILAADHLVDGVADIAQQRRDLIDEATALSGLMADAIDHQVVMDPQMAMHAYNGIEVLLFQPLRQQMEQLDVTVGRDQVADCLKPLLSVVRTLAQRSELVNLIHPEAVNRMIRMGYTDDLTNEDIMAVLRQVQPTLPQLTIRKVHCLANADAEFDFNESFWRYELSLSRYNPTDLTAQSPNDRLLEVQSDTSPNHPPLPAPPIPVFQKTGDPSSEDPLARLQSVLATNSQRNSESQSDVEEGQVGRPGPGDGSLALPYRGLESMLGMPGGEDNGAFPLPWFFSGSSGQ